MLILKAEDVKTTVPMKEAIEAMKKAYASLSDRSAVVPQRIHLSIPDKNAISLFMPAYMKNNDDEALAVKVVSLFPNNPARGLAYIQAAVLVIESDTGRAMALLEGSTLTAIRTGAGSGASIDLLARKDSKVLAIFGAGPQGKTQLEAACAVRDIEKVFIYNPTQAKAEKFVEEMSVIHKNIHVAKNPKEAIEQADIICTATGSKQPVFDDKDVKAGTHISAIGAYTPDMQELPIETVARSKIVVDYYDTVISEAGDIVKAMKANLITEKNIHAELGEIVLGKKVGRENDNEITFFKSVGNAVQDAVAAQVALKNAKKMKIGQEIEF
ncbi:MAG: Ornithine cyclodeaminase [Chloroflexi bacterium OLB14]|nr:MAG: Ornithine cyclodeaminase [Chloroflexi bacterium OLB14]